MHRIALVAGKAVLIQQGHEQLEVLLLAVVWCGRHQQQVAGVVAHPLAHLVALGALHLAAVVVGTHSVRFVAHHQVPFLGLLQSVLQLLVPRQHVHPGDQQRPLLKRVAQPGGVDHLAGEQLELQLELLLELVLPLLGERARRHDQAALQLAADQQLLDQQAGHDRLAGAGIIRQQEAHRLARQHVLIDRTDLVGQRVNRAAAYRHVGVK